MYEQTKIPWSPYLEKGKKNMCHFAPAAPTSIITMSKKSLVLFCVFFDKKNKVCTNELKLLVLCEDSRKNTKKKARS